MRWSPLCAVPILLAVATARADVAVALEGEPTLQPALKRELEGWLTRHGYQIGPPLPAGAIATISDCFVIETPDCARGTVRARAAAAVAIVVFVRIEVQQDGSLDLAGYWIVKDATGAPATERRRCDRCREDTKSLASTTDALLTTLAKSSPPPPRPIAPPKPAPPTPGVHTTNDTASAIRKWHVGISIGAAVPRSDLDLGLLLGVTGTFRIDREDRWRGGVWFDWVRTGRRENTLLSPPEFPRSRGDLDDRRELVTVAAGGSARVARFGGASLRVAVAGGITLARVRFEAYGMPVDETGVGPAVTVDLVLSGRAGPVGWRGQVGWREAMIDLGDGQGQGQEVTSGAIVAVGADW